MTKEDLCRAAAQAAQHAYAPFSKYSVGAAVLTGTGAVYTGANVENSSYGLTVCAERSAIFNAVTQGERTIQALAVSTKDGAMPCGACRQVLLEFGSSGTIVYVVQDDGILERTLSDLLPEPFGPNR